MKPYLLIALSALACARAPSRIEIAPVADGEWHVLHTRDDGALLRYVERGGRRERGSVVEPRLAVFSDTLRPVRFDTFSLAAGKSSVHLANVDNGRFFFAPNGPQLIPSPKNEEVYAFEHEHGIWVFKSRERSVNRLTSDAGLDSLLAKQREGEVILYWASNPLWTGDGDFISFVTNRAAVRAGVRGQQLWVVNSNTGIENDLFVAPGVNAHNDGVFEDDIVMSSDRAPGIYIVSPRDSSAARISDGYLVTYEKHGNGILVNDNGQLLLFMGGEEQPERIPAPAPGLTWTPTASISRAGRRVAVYATDGSSKYILYVFTVGKPAMVSSELPGLPVTPPVWISDRDMIFTAAALRAEPKTYRARVH